MLVSMTGFGRAEATLPSVGRAVIEVRAVNHRFLEVEARLPEGMSAFEEEARAAVRQALRRGQVRVTMALRAEGAEGGEAFQPAVARRYVSHLRRLQRQLRLPGQVDLRMVVGLPQVMAGRPRAELESRHWRLLEEALRRALAQLVRMRQREGQRLARAIGRHRQALARLSREIRRRAPQVERAMRQRLLKRIEELLAKAPAPPGEFPRGEILAEAAHFVQATDVSEELDRIASHLTALERADSGRTMDFLAQELQREVNTLGTKLRDASVLRSVVAMKGQIESIREQAANLE